MVNEGKHPLLWPLFSLVNCYNLPGYMYLYIYIYIYIYTNIFFLHMYIDPDWNFQEFQELQFTYSLDISIYL